MKIKVLYLLLYLIRGGGIPATGVQIPQDDEDEENYGMGCNCPTTTPEPVETITYPPLTTGYLQSTTDFIFTDPWESTKFPFRTRSDGPKSTSSGLTAWPPWWSHTTCVTIKFHTRSPFPQPTYPPWWTSYSTRPSYYPHPPVPTQPSHGPQYSTCFTHHPYPPQTPFCYSTTNPPSWFYTVTKCQYSDIIVLLCYLKQLPPQFCHNVLPSTTVPCPDPTEQRGHPIHQSDLPYEVSVILCYLNIFPQKLCTGMPISPHATSGSFDNQNQLIMFLCTINKLPSELCRNLPPGTIVLCSTETTSSRLIYPSDLPRDVIQILCTLRYVPQDWCNSFSYTTRTTPLVPFSIMPSDFPKEIIMILCLLNKFPSEWCQSINKNTPAHAPKNPSVKPSDIPHEALVILCRLHKLPQKWCEIITACTQPYPFPFTTCPPTNFPSCFTTVSIQPANLSWEWIVYLCCVLKLNFSWCPVLPTTWPPWLSTYPSNPWDNPVFTIEFTTPTPVCDLSEVSSSMPTWLCILWWWCYTFVVSPTLCGLFPFPGPPFPISPSLQNDPRYINTLPYPFSTYSDDWWKSWFV